MYEISRLKARELLSSLKLGEPPVDVELVARSCGLTISYVNKGKGFFGQLLKGRRVIEVQGGIHSHGQRFTIAHEIGHYILGHDSISNPFAEDIMENPRAINDRQANAFASELLMPVDQVNKHWILLRKDYREMAKRFQVSDTAMFLRLEEAKLV